MGGKSLIITISRVLLASCVYTIGKDRNARIFQNSILMSTPFKRPYRAGIVQQMAPERIEIELFLLRKKMALLLGTLKEVKLQFTEYFQRLLGSTSSNTYPGKGKLREYVDKVISYENADVLARDIIDEEIKQTFFSLNPNKAPGPDGFNGCFFRKTWHILGNVVIMAIKSFFQTGSLLKEVNATIIALIPKVPNPSKLKDYRPISCCNTLYK